MFNFLKKKDEEKSETAAAQTSSPTPSTTTTTTTVTTTKSKSNSNSNSNSNSKSTTPLNLLVIDAHFDENYYELFANCHLSDGRPIQIEQSGWKDISLTAYSDSKRAVVQLRRQSRPKPNTPQNDNRTFMPHFVLCRNLVTTVKQNAGNDFRNLMFAFVMAQTPCVNTWRSIYALMERPLMTAELIRLNRVHGQTRFPVIPQQYFYPSFGEMVITPSPYPLVMKMGAAHAGYGKMLLQTHKQFEDFKSVIACTQSYCTAENYVEGECDIRIQKIGSAINVFRRRSMVGNWKTNTGTATLDELPAEEIPERYRFWAQECAKCFGGMDIVTVDVLVAKADPSKEYILEFNGTASGFGDKENNNLLLRALVLQRLNETFCSSNHIEDEESNANNTNTNTNTNSNNNNTSQT